MEYLCIVGTVLVIVGGTFCFAALQWPRLFTTVPRAARPRTDVISVAHSR